MLHPAPSSPAPQAAAAVRSLSRDASLDGVRGVAIAMVVAIHTFGYVKLPDGPIADLLALLVRTVAVPMFFLVDGFLFARAQRTGRAFDAGLYVRRSARRLLLPWLVFSLLYLVLRWVYELVAPTDVQLLTGRGPAAWIETLLLGRASEQLYFLPSLFAIRLLAAPIRALAFRGAVARWLAFVAAACGAGFLMGSYRSLLPLPGYDPILHALWGLPFYLLGVAATDLWRRGPVPAIAAAAALVAARLGWPKVAWATEYAYLAALFLLFASFDITPAWLAAVGRRTMAIYLLHAPIVLRAVSLACERVVHDDPFLRFGLVWAGSFAISLLLALLLERSALGRLVLGEQR